MSLTRPIILSRPDRVGDVIISSACLAAVKAHHPEAPLYLLVKKAMWPLFEGHPLLAGLLEAFDFEQLRRPESRWRLVEPEKLVERQLREIDAGAIVQLQPDHSITCAAVEVGIPVRLGYSRPHWGSQAQTQSLPDLRQRGGQHERDFCFDVLGLPPLEVRRDSQAMPSLGPNLVIPDSLREKLPAGRFAAVNPGAYSENLRWPVEMFGELCVRLQIELGLSIVVIGTSREDRSVARLLARIGDAICVAGETNLAELGGLLRLAAVHISRDTGTAHLASAVGCPVVTLFGRTAPEYGPERWRPLGPGPVQLVVTDVGPKRWFGFEPTKVYWRRGFARLSVERVFEAVKKALAPSTGR